MASNEAIPTWEQVATDYGRVIYNFAYRLTGNRDDASDLAQEVLLRVRRGLANYKPGSFEGWLWRITRNAFLDEVRRKKRRPTVELPDDDRSALVTSPTPDDVLAETRLSSQMQYIIHRTYFFFQPLRYIIHQIKNSFISQK